MQGLQTSPGKSLMIMFDYLIILFGIKIFIILKVWKIVDRNIHSLKEKISFEQKIKSIEWIHNGSELLLWWENVSCIDNNRQEERNNQINECQIKVR